MFLNDRNSNAFGDNHKSSLWTKWFSFGVCNVRFPDSKHLCVPTLFDHVHTHLRYLRHPHKKCAMISIAHSGDCEGTRETTLQVQDSFWINGLALNESIGNILITAIGPLVYTFFWDGMTSKGIVIGTLLSTSLAAFMRFGLSVPKRIDHAVFKDNDVFNTVLYAIAITLGFVLPPLVVCIEKIWRKIDHESRSRQLCTAWARVYEMDNPLNPWALNYAKSFLFANFDMQSYSRPSFQEVKRAYRFSWYFALAGPFIFCFLFVGVMPMMFSIVNVMDLVTFKAWSHARDIHIVAPRSLAEHYAKLFSCLPVQPDVNLNITKLPKDRKLTLEEQGQNPYVPILDGSNQYLQRRSLIHHHPYDCIKNVRTKAVLEYSQLHNSTPRCPKRRILYEEGHQTRRALYSST
ncbi:hypothetical protein ACTXT7_006056 [Hymenolepis weldensis]